MTEPESKVCRGCRGTGKQKVAGVIGRRPRPGGHWVTCNTCQGTRVQPPPPPPAPMPADWPRSEDVYPPGRKYQGD